MKSNKGAMEMSIGTIVTIVLLMSVLVLGIFLVQRVFSSSTNAIDSVDTKLNAEINKMFGDSSKRVVVYPTEEFLKMKQGQSGGFGFSIKNLGADTETYHYSVNIGDVSSDCTGVADEQAGGLIKLGKEGNNIVLGSGQSMDTAKFVRYDIPKTFPLCLMRFTLTVYDSMGEVYSQHDIDLDIIA